MTAVFPREIMEKNHFKILNQKPILTKIRMNLGRRFPRKDNIEIMKISY